MGTVCYSKFANFQERLCNVEFLKPKGALKYLRNLDVVNDFSDIGPVRILADEDEPELDPLLFQRISLGESVYISDIRSLFFARNIEGHGCSQTVRTQNVYTISKQVSLVYREVIFL